MKLIEMAGKIPGFEVRRQQFDGNEAVSIIGPAKVIAFALKFALLTTLVGIEQIVRYGVRRDGTKVHLVLFQNPTVKLDKSQETAPIGVIDGYTYVHSVTALKGEINVGLFDKGFNPDNTAQAKAFARLCDAIFASGKVRGADTNTLLLLGRAVKDRVLAAYRWAQIDDNGDTNFAALTTIGGNDFANARYATVKDNTILAVEYHTGNIAALNVDQITSMLDNSTTPEWQTMRVKGVRIEDITPSIGDSATVAVTALITNAKKADERKLLLGHAVWTKRKGEQTFNFIIDTKYEADLPVNAAPVTRLTATTVTAVDGNGGTASRLQIAGFPEYDPANAGKLREITTAAASGAAYQQAIADAA